jgi:hypothetical protein
MTQHRKRKEQKNCLSVEESQLMLFSKGKPGTMHPFFSGMKREDGNGKSTMGTAPC